jgi:hypothetical protein
MSFARPPEEARTAVRSTEDSPMNPTEPGTAARRPNYRFEVIRLMWGSHPWLTLAMAVTGVLSGLASIAVVDTINTAIHEAGRRPGLALSFAGLSLAALILRSCASRCASASWPRRWRRSTGAAWPT